MPLWHLMRHCHFLKKALMPLVAFGGFGRLLDGCMAGFVPVCGDAWLASCPLGHSAIYFNTKNKSLCETQFIYANQRVSLHLEVY